MYEAVLPTGDVFVGTWREIECEVLSIYSEDEIELIELDDEERDLLP